MNFQGRSEDNRPLTGQGLYVAAIAHARMAIAVVVRAQVASARVTSIDTNAAVALTRGLAPGRTDKGIGHLAREEGRHKIRVEAVRPAGQVGTIFEVHHVCRDLGISHMEGLCNLDKVVGKGRFRFIGFPLKIKGGTGSPSRALARRLTRFCVFARGGGS